MTQACVGKNRVESPGPAVDTFLTYGMPFPERENARNVVADRWGITFRRVGGCCIDSVLADSVERHDQWSDCMVALRHGKGWDTTFYKEVGKEFEKQQIARKILFTSAVVAKMVAAQEKEGHVLDAYLTPAGSAYTYKVSLSGWGEMNGKDEWVSYYRLTVNYMTREVRMIDSVVIKEE